MNTDTLLKVPVLSQVKEKLLYEEDKLSYYFQKSKLWFFEFIPSLIISLVVLTVGFWVIKRIIWLVERGMIRREMDISLRNFLKSLLSIGLKIVLIIGVASFMGIGTASFVTILGAAGLAIGLALQGSLSNFAGGVLILVFKPFKVGDIIEAQGQIGEVKEIQIFNTMVLTADYRTVIFPNGPLSNDIIINKSTQGILRLSLDFIINSTNDIVKVEKVILETLNKNELVLKDPEPKVLFSAVVDGAITVTVRPFCKYDETVVLNSQLNIQIKKAFEENKVVPHIQTRIVENINR